MKRLDGKVAIVTGSSDGIGKMAATSFAAEGARVVICGRDDARASAAANEILGNGGEATWCCGDLAEEATAEALVVAAVDRWGRLDVVVNNAAVSEGSVNGADVPVAGMDVGTWRRIFDVNLIGPALLSKYAIPAMISSGGGSIVMSSSSISLTGAPAPANSCAKGALNLLAQHIATVYGRNRIRANAIAIGPVATEGHLRRWPADIRRLIQRHTSLDQYGQPEDIVQAMMFLASDESKFISGVVLRVDGGLLSHMPYYTELIEGRDIAHPIMGQNG